MTFDITMGKRHKIQTNVEAFNALPEKVFFCERLQLATGTLNLLCGAGNAGKTFLAQYLATCAATGSDLFGSFPITKTQVLHVDQEQSESQSLTRYIRIGAGLGVDEIDDIYRTHWERLPAKLSSEHVKQLQQQLSDLLPKGGLIIIDSLRKLTFADENNGDMESLLDVLKIAAEMTNTCIILLHHKGKYQNSGTEQTGRGSSTIYDSVDSQIDITRVEDEHFELKCQKSRDDSRFENLYYTFHDEGVRIERRKCSSKIVFGLQNHRSDERAIQIFNAIKDNPNISTNKLHQKVKGDKTAMIKLLDEMFHLDHLDMKNGARNANEWSATPKGCKHYEEMEKNNE